MTLERAYYHCASCRTGFCPRDRTLASTRRRCRPRRRRMTAAAAARVRPMAGSELTDHGRYGHSRKPRSAKANSPTVRAGRPNAGQAGIPMRDPDSVSYTAAETAPVAIPTANLPPSPSACAAKPNAAVSPMPTAGSSSATARPGSGPSQDDACDPDRRIFHAARQGHLHTRVRPRRAVGETTTGRMPAEPQPATRPANAVNASASERLAVAGRLAARSAPQARRRTGPSTP